jgi:hypothetical protein
MTPPIPIPTIRASVPRALPDDVLTAEARITERDRVEMAAFWVSVGTPLLLGLLWADSGA